MKSNAKKNDFIEIGIFVKNLPANYLVLGKQVRLLALPIRASQYDYGSIVKGNANNFTNRFLVTIRGYLKPQIPKAIESNKTNAPSASKD